uniref:Uncharacterized protein n=1 Tax=Hyaloperonospora arabidopsidis (strain Emoy2) TaxID=559515 RepID=M4BCW2_HYAAE
MNVLGVGVFSALSRCTTRQKVTRLEHSSILSTVVRANSGGRNRQDVLNAAKGDGEGGRERKWHQFSAAAC